MTGKNSLYITNASLVMEKEVVHGGSILIEDGFIKAINPVSTLQSKFVDLKGKFLLPGMIDLHCDALEKEVEPRPAVYFPLNFACAQADRLNAVAGITTVFHALSFANEELGVRNNDMAASVVHAVHDWKEHALVDNRIHCRYEVTDPAGLPVLKQLMDNNLLDLLSVMNHTPGQGQFKDIASYRNYLVKTYKKAEREADCIIQRKLDETQNSMKRLEQIVEHAKNTSIPVASHDDDSPERIDMMHGLGVKISEFPINLDTAFSAREKGMVTVAGAPNILRGKSQAGSMRAVDGIRAGVIDCLCSDYSPATLVVAVFRLAESGEMPLHEAIHLVATNPARASGMEDRGTIAVGKRADLIAVGTPGNLPQVSDVWVDGTNVFSTGFSA